MSETITQHTNDTQATQETAKGLQYPTTKPRVDLYEGEEGLLVVADLPGVNKDNLKVHLHGDQLTIEGHRKGPGEGEDDNVSTEFRPTSFKRRFTLRDKVDTENVSAQLKDGVLQLKLPKAPELKPRQIEIQPL